MRSSLLLWGRAHAQGGLGFGVGSTVLGNGTPVTMLSPMLGNQGCSGSDMTLIKITSTS